MSPWLPPHDEIHRAFLKGNEAIVEQFVRIGQPGRGFSGAIRDTGGDAGGGARMTEEDPCESKKPPSCDGYAKPKRATSPRQADQHSVENQPAYRGDTLERVAMPDYPELHPVAACPGCGGRYPRQLPLMAHDDVAQADAEASS